MPDARCTRGLVCEMHKEMCTRSKQVRAEAIRHSLRDGLRLMLCSPGDEFVLSPSLPA